MIFKIRNSPCLPAGRKFEILRIFLLLFFLFFPFISKAATITPVRQTAVIDPGKTEIVEIFILNDSKKKQDFFPEVSPFIIDEQTGGALFDQIDEAEDWFDITPRNLSLDPGEVGSFSFSVSVPEGAEPGAHYFGLFASQEPKAGQVGIGTRVASLFFLHVGGLVREDLIRKSFDTKLKFYFQDNIVIKTEFENVGNIHLIPNGELKIKNMLGKEIQQINLNIDQQKILPNNLWKHDYFVENLSWKDAGYLQANIYITYGLSQKTIIDSISFWYIPLWLLIILFVILSFLSILAILMFKKRKK